MCRRRNAVDLGSCVTSAIRRPMFLTSYGQWLARPSSRRLDRHVQEWHRRRVWCPRILVLSWLLSLNQHACCSPERQTRRPWQVASQAKQRLRHHGNRVTPSGCFPLQVQSECASPMFVTWWTLDRPRRWLGWGVSVDQNRNGRTENDDRQQWLRLFIIVNIIVICFLKWSKLNE